MEKKNDSNRIPVRGIHYILCELETVSIFAVIYPWIHVGAQFIAENQGSTDETS